MSKTAFKRALFFGLSFSVILMAAMKTGKEPEGNPSPDEDGTLPDVTPADRPDLLANPPADARTLPFRPLTGITVTFSGTIVRNAGRFALRETAGVLYALDSMRPVGSFEGEDVRVTGQLDTTTRLLHIDDIHSMIA